MRCDSPVAGMGLNQSTGPKLDAGFLVDALMDPGP